MCLLRAEFEPSRQFGLINNSLYLSSTQTECALDELASPLFSLWKRFSPKERDSELIWLCISRVTFTQSKMLYLVFEVFKSLLDVGFNWTKGTTCFFGARSPPGLSQTSQLVELSHALVRNNTSEVFRVRVGRPRLGKKKKKASSQMHRANNPKCYKTWPTGAPSPTPPNVTVEFKRTPLIRTQPNSLQSN